MSQMRRPIYFNDDRNNDKHPHNPSSHKEIQTLHQQLPNYNPTPFHPLPALASDLGLRAVLIKDESNRFGLPSFKVLGASWGLYRALTARLGLSQTVSWSELAGKVGKASASMRSVIFAATDGNHGRAVAYVTKLLSLPCEVYVPGTVDDGTRRLIGNEGATVHVVEADHDTAVREAARASENVEGGLLIQDTSFEGYEEIPGWIVDGYSTMMAEIDAQMDELGLKGTTVITPVGVGSLAHAVVKHFKGLPEPARVFTVEPDTAGCFYQSLRTGQRMSVQTTPTIMDGLNCGTVSPTAWNDLSRHVDASVTVSCYESHRAVEDLASSNIKPGPCGGAPLAALRRLAKDGSHLLNKDSVVILLSTEGPRPYTTPRNVSIDDPICLTQVLTQIDSSNATLSAADGAGETCIANYISAWLAHRDIETHRVETVPGRPSVIGVIRGRGGGKSLMLNGHMDTVSLASYDNEPLSGHLTEKNGRPAIFGRGSLDMKGGLAAALSTMVTIKKSGCDLRGDVILAAVADEEDASQGTRDLIEAGWKADGAVITEPTSCAIMSAHKGFVWVDIDILGVAGHGSNPAMGVDSILLAGRFLAALESYQKQLPTDDLLGPASLHCGLINGGEEPSSYPAKCTITVEFRTVPGQTDASILADMQNLLSDISNGTPEFRYADPRITMSRPTQKLSSDHPLVRKTAELASKSLSRSPKVAGAAFWCDAALLTQAGTPTIVFGPAGDGLHAKEEWVDAESIQQVSEVLTGSVKEFCQ